MTPPALRLAPPRLGFVGLGWIGRARLDALVEAGAAEAAALCEPDPERLGDAAAAHRRADCFDAAAELLDEAGRLGLDGVVIATPTASHVELTVAALERGLAVLCQKPLAASADECRRAVAAARSADRLLGVDYTYRGLPGVARALRRVRGGLIGRVLHVHGAFHNAYGPDKEWCWDPAVAGGGAFLDLGVHLLDLTLGMLGRPALERVTARCHRDGRPLEPPVSDVEDFASVRLDFAGGEGDAGASADLAASWCAHAGADCVFRLEVFGTDGGLELVNLGGGFYDFELAVREGRRRTVVATSGEADLAAAAVTWARRLARTPRFAAEAAGSVAVAEALDRIYGRVPRIAGERRAQAGEVVAGRASGSRSSAASPSASSLITA